jgi:hypothetical protein
MNIDSAYSDNILKSTESRKDQRNNGRVPLDEAPQNARIQMMEKTAIKNKAVSYCDAISGQWEDNPLSRAYFCKDNIQIVQNAIRAGVYDKSEAKIIVPPPNLDNLMIIMRSYFLSYVQYTDDIRGQIAALNKLVVDYCVHELYSASLSYIQYTKDQSGMYMPLKPSQQVDRIRKQLEPRIGF